MCGIFGVVGTEASITALPQATQQQHSHTTKDILYAGLKKLAYRGYDSAGIALLSSAVDSDETQNAKISIQKSSGKLHKLKPLLDYLPENSYCGIAHTRWATHGPATSINAHPHRAPGLAMVHNGIIENYIDLKADLLSRNQHISGGITLISQTDTEVALACLYDIYQQLGDMKQSVLKLVSQLKGRFSFAILCDDDCHKIYLVKMGSPLVLGMPSQQEGQNDVYFCASDALAFRRYTNQVLFLEDGDVGVLSQAGYQPLAGPHSKDGGLIKQGHQQLSDDFCDTTKGAYSSFMYKEMREQPVVLSRLVARLYDGKKIQTQELALDQLDLDRITHIHLVGCGSAYFAASVGQYMMESQLRMPAHAALASEYRYRSPLITPHTLVIAVSQSGETADTLACVQYACEQGGQVYALSNVGYSSIVRSSHAAFLMEVGREIGVASTKAFTAQVLSLFFMATALAERKGLMISAQQAKDLKSLPMMLEAVFDQETALQTVAKMLHRENSCLFVGRHLNAWIAYEGALKMKEISYIHAEAYPAGELKHGPLALVDAYMCVIAIISPGKHYDKMLSNIEEIKARGGRVFALTGLHDHIGNGIGDNKLSTLTEKVITLPQLATAPLQSLIYTVALQLLAYHSATLLAYDVDQPRNLAKSVTVE
ncbi:MAG: glutamine--fructose-6-phosphate transaminase (isomerizing) [Proteobacteria bacterium]|nr:glutamine--fructose-6-phosphate transaminase (isomerizing) [Pseudomonadota bacterium]